MKRFECWRRVVLPLVAMLLFLQPVAEAEMREGEAAQYQAGARALAEQNYEEAVKIWSRLARRGNADAAFNLGVLYAEGRVVEQDPRAAIRWLKKAARRGHPEAQYNLGHLYMQGASGKPRPKKAVKWWRKAALNGLVVAQYNLAYALYNGIGVEQDQEEALKWFREAAEAGEARSSAFLENLPAGEKRAAESSGHPAPAAGQRTR